MDEVFYILLGLAVILGIPGAAIAAIVIASGLKTRVAQLETERAYVQAALTNMALRVTALENRAGPSGSVVPTAEARAAASPAAGAFPEDVVAGPIPEPSAAPRAMPEPAVAAVPVPDERGYVAPSAATPPPPPLPGMTPPPFAEPVTMPEPGPARPAERSLEEALGTRWTVWIGGLALALGGVFLVKYSIEQGFFGPLARLFLAAVFSGLLLAAGEFLRRRDLAGDSDVLASAHIPAILTAAGVVASFATVFGFMLYGYIDSFGAFLLFGMVAFGAMLLSLLHGPWITMLGVLGAYATPLLIQSSSPNRLALVLYLLAVTLAAFVIARVKLWRWVATAALSLALAWGVVIAGAIGDHGLGKVEYGLYLLGVLALVAGILVITLDEALDPPEDRQPNYLALAGLTGLSCLAFVLLQLDDFGLMSRTVAGITLGSGLALAWRYPAMAPAAAISGLLALFGALTWTVNVQATLDTGVLIRGADGLHLLRPKLIGEYELLAGLLVALFVGVGFLGSLRATPQADRTAGWLAGAGAITPSLILIAAWLRIDGWSSSPVFAGCALALAAVFAFLTRMIIDRESEARPSSAVALYALGSVAALATGMTIALEKGALTIALALIVPAIAWIHGARPIAALRPLAAVVGGLVLARVMWDPRIVGSDLGATPIVNWLLYGYGIPAVGFGFAAYRFRRAIGDRAAATDVWVGCLEALTVVFAGLLAVFEIRHLVHHGDVFAHGTDVAELGLTATVGLIGASALTRISLRVRSSVLDAASLIVWTLSTFVSIVGLLLTSNPGLTGEPVGHNLVLNSLLLGYLVPALATGVTAYFSRGIRPKAFVAGNALAGLALGFTYVTLMTRHVYQGSNVAMIGAYLSILPHTSDQEFWTYSAVWLAFGLATLGLGLLLRSPTARAASAAIILLTVAKVFLLDMNALTGIFRALSFIGLGVILMAIGWLYQKLLFPHAKASSSGREA